MAFPLYPQLPLELRHKIIEEAVATRIKEARPRKAGLALWASSIHHDWTQVIERVLFQTIRINSQEIEEFAKICGKRQDLLRKLFFIVKPERPGIPMWIDPQTGHPDTHQAVEYAVGQLFDIIKDWSPAEKPGDCLKLSISMAKTPSEPLIIVPGLDCTFENLPEVPGIGGLYIESSLEFSLSNRSAHALQKKLPNLRSVQLTLPNTNDLQHAIARSRKRMNSCHAVNPDLTKLDITQDQLVGFFQVGQPRHNQVRIAQSLAPQLSLWRNTLVRLKLNCFIDPPQFLLTASDSAWPNLAKLDLVGNLDEEEIHLAGQWDMEMRVDGDFLRGLIACMPQMPRLTTVQMRFKHGWDRRICMELGARTSTNKELMRKPAALGVSRPRKLPVSPCSPLATESGIVKAHNIALPSGLVTELQDTVWRARGLNLAVFRCSETLESFDFRPPCTKWDRETDSWEPAFLNDMNEVIYALGEYLRLEWNI